MGLLTKLYETCVLSMYFVEQPVSTSNSVSDVPPPKLGTTIWPETNRIPSLLSSSLESGCVLYLPVVSLYGAGGCNRLTLSLSDPKCENRILCFRPSGYRSSLNMEITLFCPGDDRRGDSFDVTIHLDFRALPWQRIVRETVSGYEKAFPPMFTPTSAFQPFYSSWYAYFQEVTDEILEKECRIARSLGM